MSTTLAGAPDLTPTSYALLGLLNLQPWTTYELAQQMDRTLNRLWPRARSKVYEEPKKLVTHGLAKASPGSVGRRPRTVYSITAKGRRALAAWLAVDASGPVFESEHLLKAFFADAGSRDDLLRTLHGLRAWAHERTLVNIAVGRAYLDGAAPFPDRAAVNTVVGRFLDDYLACLDDWAVWATAVVDQWPDRAAGAGPDRAELQAIVEQAEARAARWERDQAGQPGTPSSSSTPQVLRKPLTTR